MELHGLDTSTEVFFYEQDFYVLSNFSAFRLTVEIPRVSVYSTGRNVGLVDRVVFDTSEAAYHWFKFPDEPAIRGRIIAAPSAHEAFKIAEQSRDFQRRDWARVKVETMLTILRLKAQQHEYVRRKLLATGDRTLIENSWRDAFWGWGPDRDGLNMLGKLWMQVRAELRAAGA